jgi:uncharacterized membrane protein
MDTLFTVLHVVAAVFIVGPMAILPMTGLRAIRSGNAAQITTLAKSVNIFTLVSLVVVFFGFAALGMSDPKYHLSIATPWIWISIVAYAIALALNLFLVVPAMRKAAAAATVAATAGGAGASAAGSAGGDVKPEGYAQIAAGSGIVSLLLLLVVVLMVWKP